MSGTADRQQALLDALEIGSCLTVDDLVAATPLTRRAVSQAAQGLMTRGYLVRVERGCFQLTGAGEAAKERGETLTSGPIRPHTIRIRTPRRRKTLRTCLWRAMPTLGKFTVEDLVSLAASGGEKAAINNAQRFVRELVRIGYVRAMPRRTDDGKPTSNGLKRYALLTHTGPFPPAKTRGGMYDRNTGELVPWTR